MGCFALGRGGDANGRGLPFYFSLAYIPQPMRRELGFENS